MKVAFRVKCLCVVDGNRSSTGCRLALVETYCDGGSKGEQSSGGGVFWFETMLGMVNRKSGSEGRKKESLQDLGGRAQERDGTV